MEKAHLLVLHIQSLKAVEKVDELVVWDGDAGWHEA